jgi:hypothetical protein
LETLGAGGFMIYLASQFINGALYIKTYQPVFAYQSTGSGINGANHVFLSPH